MWADSTVRVPDDLLVHLRRARDLIDREHAERLDVEQLAREAGYSKSTSLELFGPRTGRRRVVIWRVGGSSAPSRCCAGRT